MDAATFDEVLIGLKRRRPFRPFKVILLEDDSFEVDNPDALVVRDGAAVYIKPGGMPVIFDYESVSQVIGE